MLKEERWQAILKILSEKQYISTEELSQQLYVSLPTIRRDLSELASKNLIARSHGGAIGITEETREIPVDFRNGINMRQKSKIARKASELAKDGDVIFIDSSTTTLHIADFIKNLAGITVVTNSIQSAVLLRKNNIRTFMTGGIVIDNSLALGGSWAEEYIKKFNINIMFFSSYGISDSGFITDYSEYETNLRRAALSQSNKKVFLCDNTKFGKASTFNVCHINEVDIVVSDDKFPDNIKLQYNGCFITV
ncbi:MAG: DeoR/GlpR family DNA-binding transcription regulator [Bacillota bacterium]|nr:DeoR/GlpR family DNA-binding transcription regulator [Bacillota bacterium]